MSTVKSIFKIILGTVLVIVVSMSLIEVFNLSIYGMQVNKLSRTAAYQAAAMFTQETYNTDGRNFVGTLSDIKALDSAGNEYVYCRSNFFKSQSVSYLNISNLNDPDVKDKIHQSLFYDKNSQFYKFIEDTLTNSTGPFCDYTNLKLLGIGTINQGHELKVNTLSFGSSGLDVQKNQDFTQVNTYIKNQYTPANLGIPFIDTNVATNMFQYSLTKLLSGCDADNIWASGESVLHKTTGENTIVTEDGTVKNTGSDTINGAKLPSVYFHGFKCYISDDISLSGGAVASANCARIDKVEYTTYDLSTSTGRKEFKKDTGYAVKEEDTNPKTKAPGIHASSVSNSKKNGLAWSSSDRVKYKTTMTETGKQVQFSDINRDNSLVTVATIKYSVPMKYVGITPLAQVFNFIMGKSVAGLGTDGNGTEAKSKTEYSYNSADANLDLNQTGRLFSGDEFSGDGELSAYYKQDEVQFMLID